jgi:hypothetical protein
MNLQQGHEHKYIVQHGQVLYMQLVRAHVPFCQSMSVQLIHVHVACTNTCWMSIFMLHIHVGVRDHVHVQVGRDGTPCYPADQLRDPAPGISGS